MNFCVTCRLDSDAEREPCWKIERNVEQKFLMKHRTEVVFAFVSYKGKRTTYDVEVSKARKTAYLAFYAEASFKS